MSKVVIIQPTLRRARKRFAYLSLLEEYNQDQVYEKETQEIQR